MICKDKIKAYREANKDKIKAYYEANKDKIKAWKSLPLSEKRRRIEQKYSQEVA